MSLTSYRAAPPRGCNCVEICRGSKFWQGGLDDLAATDFPVA